MAGRADWCVVEGGWRTPTWDTARFCWVMASAFLGGNVLYQICTFTNQTYLEYRLELQYFLLFLL